MATLLAINTTTGRPTKLAADDTFSTTGAVGTGTLQVGGSGVIATGFSSGDVGTNSATLLPTQSAIVTYVAAQVATANELAEMTDVTLTTPGDAALMLYDAGTSQWRDAAMSGHATISDTGVVTVATLNQNTTGSAATLTSARTIGGVSFNGSANIDLAGVNIAGNQDTSGVAATATALATSRDIGGVAFNGTAAIDLPGVNAVGSQNTTGSAATLTTSRNIGGVSFNGSAAIDLPGVNAVGNQNTTGNAATATTAGTVTTANQAAITSIGPAGTLTVNQDLTVAGTLTVSGTTTTVNTATVSVEDPLMLLSSGAAGSASVDAGFVIERGDDVNAGFFWDESADEFACVSTADTGATAGNVTIASYHDLQCKDLAAQNIAGTLTTASQTNITGVGTIATGVWSGTALVAGKVPAITALTGYSAGGYANASSVGAGSIVTTGALDSGSITSNFGSINNGSSAITTTGAVGTGALTATSVTSDGNRSFAASTTNGFQNTTLVGDPVIPYTYWWDSQTVQTFDAAETIRAGDILFIDSAGKVGLAANNVLTEVDAIIGFAGAGGAADALIPAQCGEGISVLIEGWDGANGVNEDWSTKVGKMVFLGVGGKPTMTAPSAADTAVMQVGIIRTGGINAAADKVITVLKRLVFFNEAS